MVTVRREVSRKRLLSTFRIDVAELELLWNRLLELFADKDKVHASITVELGNEKFDFDRPADLAECADLPATVNNFYLYMSHAGRRVTVGANSFVAARPEVRATGDTEAWCAGAVETAVAFLDRHRVWYHWFLVAPVGWLLLVCIYGVALAMAFAPRDTKVPTAVAIGWAALTVVLLVLFFSRAKLLPVCALEVRDEPSFLRRYAGELTLLVAAISAVLTVVGWFVSK
ncbi:MAG: hypothetical protein KGJ40_03400 [candidate division NC10 bacterium]|nr:hypothetical protein [candidate division NC10 bacterium]